MQTQIFFFIKACKNCNEYKYDRSPYNIKICPRPIEHKPLQRVHVDLFFINKHYFMTFIDAFSKYAQAYYISSKNIIDVQHAFLKFFSSIAIPNSIYCDNEAAINSTQIRGFLSELNIELHFVSSSESNGQIERFHSTLIEIINTNKDKLGHQSPIDQVYLAVALYNNTVHSSTKIKPNEILFNQFDEVDPTKISENADKMYDKVIMQLEKQVARMKKNNENKEDVPQVSKCEFLKQTVRSKLAKRYKECEIKDQDHKVIKLKNKNNTKRNITKLTRLKR